MVIVNYRSWPDVVRLVNILGNALFPVEILVVDNASPEPVPEVLKVPIPGLRLVLNGENAGFSAGVNAGWKVAQGDWLLVLNPDVLPEAGWVEGVGERINEYESRSRTEPGVVGFGLLNPDGSSQPSVGVFPSLVRTAWEQLIPRDRRKYQPDWRVRPGVVDWVTGACMLVNSRLLAELGGMDDDFFLYYEEVALCRSAADHGWPVEFDPSLSLVHLRPLQNRAISPKMRVITRHSKLLYFRKHRPYLEFRRLCLIVGLEARARLAWSRFRGRTLDARSWRMVEQVAALMGSGVELRGREVLAMAEALEEPGDEDDRADPCREIPTDREQSRSAPWKSPRTRPARL